MRYAILNRLIVSGWWMKRLTDSQQKNNYQLADWKEKFTPPRPLLSTTMQPSPDTAYVTWTIFTYVISGMVLAQATISAMTFRLIKAWRDKDREELRAHRVEDTLRFEQMGDAIKQLREHMDSSHRVLLEESRGIRHVLDELLLRAIPLIPPR